MARVLYLYQGITPNVENGVYLVGTGDALINNLRSKLLKTITLNNYRVNTDTIKVKYTNDFNALVTHKVSYIIDADIENNQVNYFKAFFVNGFTQQSDMVIFKVSMDLWATYHNDIKLTNAIATRCNRRIGNGYYEPISETITNTDFTRRLVAMGGLTGSNTGYGVKYLNESDARIVFLAKIVTARNLAGTESHSITTLLCIDLNDARSAYNHYGDSDRVDGVTLAIDLVSHIYGTGDTQADFAVDVIRAWVVTKDMAFKTPTSSYFGLKSKPFYNNHNAISINCYVVKPSHIVETKTLALQTHTIEYKYYAGVYGDGLEIRNEINTAGGGNDNVIIELEYCVSESDITITIMQGDRQKDITTAFEVSLSGQSQNESNIQKLQRWAHNISNMIGMGKSAVQAGMVPDTYGLLSIVPVAQYICGLASDIKDVRPAGTITKGGGACTFAWSLGAQDIQDRLINYPLYFTRFRSAFNESYKARHFGGQFIRPIGYTSISTLLSGIETYALLGSDASFSTTFIALDAYIEGAPLEAINYIRNLLHNGMYLKSI